MTDNEQRRCAIYYLTELKNRTEGYGKKWLELAIDALKSQPEWFPLKEYTISTSYKEGEKK